MSKKLWHDDVRRPPDDSWLWARTNEEARLILVSIAEHRKAVGDQLLAEEARGQITSPLDEATRAAITLLAVAGDDSVLREAILGLMDRAGIPEQAVSCWIEQRPRPGEKP